MCYFFPTLLCIGTEKTDAWISGRFRFQQYLHKGFGSVSVSNILKRFLFENWFFSARFRLPVRNDRRWSTRLSSVVRKKLTSVNKSIFWYFDFECDGRGQYYKKVFGHCVGQARTIYNRPTLSSIISRRRSITLWGLWIIKHWFLERGARKERPLGAYLNIDIAVWTL